MSNKYIKIELSDNDIISLDENTGNIVVPFINDVQKDDIVLVHFVEDESTIEHKYVVTLVDGPDAVTYLNWIEMIDHTLNEANPIQGIKDKLSSFKAKRDQKNSYENQIKQNNDNRASAYENIKKNGSKIVGRDMSAAGGDWKFYLQKDDGSYTDALSQKQVKGYYDKVTNDNLIPAVINAFVTTDTNFLVRRGLQDLDKTGTRLSKETATIPDGYYVETPSQNYTIDVSKILKDEEDDPANIHGKQDSDTAKNTEAEKDSETDKNTEEPAKEKAKSNRIYISRAMIDKFRKLASMTGLKVVDADGKSVNINSLNTKNLTNSKIQSNGKEAPLTSWLRFAVKEGILKESLINEANIYLSDDELNDPSSFSIKDKIARAMDQERIEKEQSELNKIQAKLKEKYNNVIEKLNQSIHSNESTDVTLDMLFDMLVPAEGPAETVAGEMIRAIVRILYRDYNDGDRFFTGYGIETCGSSAEYLYDIGFDSTIDEILDDDIRLADKPQDDEYTEAILSLGKEIINRILEDNSLLWTFNDIDSRDYSTEYIEENQPRYELSIEGSDAVKQLVDKGVLDAWDLNSYVEDQLKWNTVFADAEVNRPWSHHSTEVTISNLTKDGYELLTDELEHSGDKWWNDLTDEYADELEDDDDYYDDEYDDSDEDE